jgi:type I restriction enzyme S subunit
VNWVCSKQLDPEFLKYLFIAEGEGLLRFASGAVHQTIYFPEAKAFHVCHPPLAEQRRIVGILDEAFEGIATARASAERSRHASKEVFQRGLQQKFAEVAARWESRKLGDVCATGSGGTPLRSQKAYYEGGTIPWLLSGEVAQGEIFQAANRITPKALKESSARLFPENTVLVAMYGATAGEVGILRFESATNQAVCGILPSSGFVPEYLFYLFLAKKAELVAQAAGNAQPNISQVKIRSLDVPLAPVSEQERMVRALDALRDATTHLETVYQNKLAALDELKKSLLHQAFTGAL